MAINVKLIFGVLTASSIIGGIAVTLYERHHIEAPIPFLEKLQTDKTVKHIWPNTDEPLPSEGDGGVMISGSEIYHKKQVDPGKWQWVRDYEAEEQSQEEQNKKHELWVALSTRVLSDDEMKRVVQYGSYINVEPNVGHNPSEKLMEIQNALIIQQMLRAQSGNCQNSSK